MDQPEQPVRQAEQELKEDFLEDRFRALFFLGLRQAGKEESSTLSFLRYLSEAFFDVLTNLPELELAREEIHVTAPDPVIQQIISAVPYAIGSEYINAEWISRIFVCLNTVFSEEIHSYTGTVQSFLAQHNEQLKVPERVFFHLVENKDEAAYPFAFLATYATRNENGLISHMPLNYALTEFKNDRDRILALLSCLNQVAEVSPLLNNFITSGEMFHPLRFTAQEAYEFLCDVEKIEQCGVLCRIPNWWKKRYASVSMNVKLGETKPSMLGAEALISMQPELAVNGVSLTMQEIQMLLKSTEGLANLKGRWIEVDHAKLKKLLEEMKEHQGSLTLMEALRMQTGVEDGTDPDGGVQITNGKWLREILGQMQRPSSIRQLKVPAQVHAVLRPYQEQGYNWLLYMQKLGFGACLADDMGLGKTLQVLTWLEKVRERDKNARILLIVPASLLGNWTKEADKFTPKIAYRVLHGMSAGKLDALLQEEECFLNITTYGMAARMKALEDIVWDCVILDEAQAIKNPGTAQTRNIKKLQAKQRIAMTGTPIENDLTNLWSLFDFLNKGLLGTAAQFRAFSKQLSVNPSGYAKLKSMVSPFILRRLKTDKCIISDLPEKLEQIEYVGLSKKQVVLYRKQVTELADSIDQMDGMQRRGLVLATITKLKQICNHPDQFLGQETFDPADSGKFQMLKDLCTTIYEKRERALIFTQFKEITGSLAAYLETIFHSPGLVLHGGTSVKKRNEMVEAFNGEAYVPFMVISVKAGGTGLNLTAANHVIHFDRWWNPAVENQATDRAFRIGQKKNVIVHKLVSEGTVEEKIDALINSKKELAENVIGSGGEKWITEMSDQELLNLMRLEA